MGVVHKLKKDVVFFILQAKKLNHGLSCRNIADMASQQFQLRVSKSSVNNILKEASLSSSVGRRGPGAPSSKKFKIPQKKKEILAENFKKAVLPLKKKVDLPKAEKSSFKEKTSGDVLPPKISIIDQKKIILSAEKKVVDSVDFSDEKVFQKKSEDGGYESGQKESVFSRMLFKEEIEAMRAQRDRERGALMEGAGSVFLKAAQWELFGGKGFDSLFDKGMDERFSGEWRKKLKILSVLEMLGRKSHEVVGRISEHFLWKAEGLPKEEVDAKSLEDWTRIIKFSLSETMSCQQKIDVALMRVSGFCLQVANGEKIYLDACCQVASDSAIKMKLFLPVSSALKILSEKIISGKKPVILSSIDRSCVKKLCDVLRGVSGKKIERVGVLGEEEEEILSFSSIPEKERRLSFVWWPNQGNIEKWSSSIKWARRKLFYQKAVNKGFLFSEVRADLTGENIFGENAGEMRSIVIWEESKDSPVACLQTTDYRIETKALVEMFLSGYVLPMSNKENVDDSFFEDKEERSEEIEEWNSAWALYSRYFLGIKKHCREEYFGLKSFSDFENRFIAKLYGLSGYLLESKGSLVIDLVLREDSEFKQKIKEAALRVNARRITDEKGRILAINPC